MTLPVISAFTAAALILLQNLLMMNVGFHRTARQIGVGAGQDIHLERKMRRHANLAENSALFIVVLALAELIGADAIALAAIAAAFVLCRLFHAIGFGSLAGSHLAEGSKFFLAMRAVGATGSAFIGFGLAGYLIYTLVTQGALTAVGF